MVGLCVRFTLSVIQVAHHFYVCVGCGGVGVVMMLVDIYEQCCTKVSEFGQRGRS